MNGLETLNFNLLEICGRGYVVEHCVAAFLKKQKHKLYQVYITDTLKMIAENTSNLAGGRSPSMRWLDVAEQAEDPEPEKTAEEVIDHIKEKLAKM